MSRLQKSIEKENVGPFFKTWADLESDIRKLLGNKDPRAGDLMHKGVDLYKTLLAQCSSEEERLEPLNNGERLGFIEGNIHTYAAYRQLDELFTEMQKKIAARRAMIQ